jgi:hypothetical protein
MTNLLRSEARSGSVVIAFHLAQEVLDFQIVEHTVQIVNINPRLESQVTSPYSEPG